MRVPTEAEWDNYQADLDQEHTHKMFGGRTNQEMIPHFQMNVIERTDELRWMPPIPFSYYMLGFRDFIMTGQFEETWTPDAASCFLGLVLESSKNNRNLSNQSCRNFFRPSATSQEINQLLEQEKPFTAAFWKSWSASKVPLKRGDRSKQGIAGI